MVLLRGKQFEIHHKKQGRDNQAKRVHVEAARVESRVDLRSHCLRKPLGETCKTVHALRLIVSPLLWCFYEAGQLKFNSNGTNTGSCTRGITGPGHLPLHQSGWGPKDDFSATLLAWGSPNGRRTARRLEGSP